MNRRGFLRFLSAVPAVPAAFALRNVPIPKEATIRIDSFQSKLTTSQFNSAEGLSERLVKTLHSRRAELAANIEGPTAIARCNTGNMWG